ncbi:MAG TPA: phosphate ABC transporter ATP-binding protein PstB [Candidatus Limnocylindria bacterium]|jgi:phosphate transport system ATP-binding protein|nr:phosphate ABC transporter ATP-binding protein PstB [Candidatus Limnocylindria bacterium]
MIGVRERRPVSVATPTAPPPSEVAPEPAVRLERLNAYYGGTHAVGDVSLELPSRAVTAIIGPSGCGKSTLLRCLNRMHELTPGARVTGQVFLGNEDIYWTGVDPVEIRGRVGMVFQKPNPFPMMSVYDNVAAGPRLRGWSLSKSDMDELVERNLRRAALWDEVKDKLRRSGAALSGGQQQRLCIARALATDPSVVLMDEPCSALDPIATYRIEELVSELAAEVTMVIVTHNMQQASRVSSHTAFMLAGDDGVGRLIEYGRTDELFTTPRDERTEAYITGRFG